MSPLNLIKSFLRRRFDASAWLRGEDDLAAGAGSKMSLPYAQVSWVFAGINKVAGPISAVELCWLDNDEEVEDPALEDWWDAPALNADGSRMSQAEFLHCLASWLCLNGEFFLVLDDTWMLPFSPRTTPLIVARPEKMRHVVSGGKLDAWVLASESGQQITLLKEQVIHVKLWNPYDPWRGLGPIQAANVAAGADYASATYQKNIAESNGDQGVYVVAKGGIPTDEQREQIISELRRKRARQQNGVFTPIFLSGDITIEDPKVRAMDAAFLASRLENRREIAAALGVPPSMFDPQASYSVGSASDRFILIEETCKPLGEKICGGLARVAQRQTKRPLSAELDWDDHSTMQQVRRERIDAAAKLWSLGMPMMQVNDYLSLDMPEFPGWEIGYLPFSVQPVEQAPLDPVSDPDLAELPPGTTEDQPDPTDELKATLRSAFAQRGETRASNEAVWRSHMNKRRGTVQAFKSKVTRRLFEARKEVLAKLEGAKGITGKSVAADFLFNLADFASGLIADTRKVSALALQDAGNDMFRELGRDDPFTMPSAETLKFLGERQNLIQAASQDIWDRVRGQLEEGFKAGETSKELAARVRTTFNGLSDYEAQRIANTETAVAYGTGRQRAMVAAGVKYKAWISSHGPNVRPAHQAAEATYGNNPIPVDEPFIVGGEALMYPGDPAGSPSNVINCQCVQIAVAAPEEET